MEWAVEFGFPTEAAGGEVKNCTRIMRAGKRATGVIGEWACEFGCSSYIGVLITSAIGKDSASFPRVGFPDRYVQGGEMYGP